MHILPNSNHNGNCKGTFPFTNACLDLLAMDILLAAGCLRLKKLSAGGTPVHRGSTDHRE